MITHLRGALTGKRPELAVVDVHGVGYRVFIPLSTFANLPPVGEAVHFFTITYVREDTFLLYGFLTEEERALFNLLLTVTGIGPKLALAVLSALTPGEAVEAIAREDLTKLARVSGIGRRLAQRLVMELKDRLALLDVPIATPMSPTPSALTNTPASLRDELTSALLNLGYKRPDVERAVRQVLAEGNGDLGSGLRAGLRLLAPNN